MGLQKLAHVHITWEDENDLYDLSGQTKRVVLNNSPAPLGMDEFARRFTTLRPGRAASYSLDFEEIDDKAFVLTKTPKVKTFEQGYHEGYEAALEEMRGFLRSDDNHAVH